MTTSYPGAQDSFTRPQPGDPQNNPSHSQLHDDAFDAIEAIEAELGLDPAGSFATVVARLSDVDSQIAGKADAGHTHAAGDAQTLDGLDSSQFLRSDTSDTFTGSSLFLTNDFVNLVLGDDAHSGDRLRLHRNVSNNYIDFSGSLHLRPNGSGGSSMVVSSAGDVTIKGNTAWHAGNDGPGSGLEADLVDGVQGADIEVWSAEVSAPIAAGGWVTIATLGASRAFGEFYVWDTEGGDHAFMHLEVFRSYWSAGVTVLNTGGHAQRITGARIVEDSADTIYGDKRLQVQVTTASVYRVRHKGTDKLAGFTNITPVTPVLEHLPAGYQVQGDVTGLAHEFGSMATTGELHAGIGMKINGNPVWHAGNDGPGSGLDADTVDGLGGSQFLRSDADDTFTGTTLTFASWAKVRFDNGSDVSLTSTNHPFQIGSDGGTNLAIDGNEIHARNNGAASTLYLNSEGGNVHINGQKAWHAGNDGSGSGLDADRLDGQQGSYYSPASHNHDSAYVNVAGDTMSGTLTVPNLTLANPGVGNTSTINFAKTNDTAQVRVTEVAPDETRFEFYMSDNPDHSTDKFLWRIDDYQGDGGDWVPLSFSARKAQVIARETKYYGNVSVEPNPFYTGVDGEPGTVFSAKTGTLDLALGAWGYTGTTVARVYWIEIDGTGTPNTFKWGIGSYSNENGLVATSVPITGSAQTLDSGVTVTFDGTSGGVIGDVWQFTVYPSGKLTAGTVDATNVKVGGNSVWHTGNDGAASGLDADMVDGLHAGSFARLDILNLLTGGSFGLVGADPTNWVLTVRTDGEVNPRWLVSANGHLQWADGTAWPDVNLYRPAANQLRTDDTFIAADVQINGNSVWHPGNDGSGSGLDADMLDGQHGSYYSPASHNHDSAYVNVAGDTMSGTLTVPDLTLSNPGIGSTSTLKFLKTNDTAEIRVTEVTSDSTTFEFFMSDNPDGTEDKFRWRINDWQGRGGDWLPLRFSGRRVRILGVETQYYGNLNVNSGPFTTGLDGDPGLIWAQTTGSLNLTADVSGFTSGTQRLYWVKIDGTGTPDTFRWGTGSHNLESNLNGSAIPITGAAQTLDNGVTITFSGTAGGVVGDVWQFTVYPSGKLTAGTVDATNVKVGGNSVWHTGNDGAGSGLDADTVDGLEASQFLRSDQNGTLNGNLDIYPSSSQGVKILGVEPFTSGQAWLTLDSPATGGGGDDQAAGISIGESGYKGSASMHLVYTGDGYGHIGMGVVTDGASMPIANTYLRMQWQGTVAKAYQHWNFENDVTFKEQVRLAHQGDVSLSSTEHALQIGPDTGDNMAFDGNEIMARGNGAASILRLNQDGGDVYINGQKAWHAGNDGSGSGLDADLLDGVQGANFLRSDIDDTVSSMNLYFDVAGGDSMRVYLGASNRFIFAPQPGGTADWGKEFGYHFTNERWEFDAAPYAAGSRVLTTADEGTLDAGTLDGLNSPQFLRSDTGDTFTGGELSVAIGSYLRLKGTTDVSLTSTGHALQIGADTGANLAIDNNEIQARNNGAASNLWLNQGGGAVLVEGLLQANAGLTILGNTAWHAGNDGSGSGLDADLLDGQHASAFATKSGQTYTVTNDTTDRTFDADSTTVDELADVLATLIADLQATGAID